MTRQLVFIPISRAELAAIDGSLRLGRRAAYRVTSELLAALEYGPGQEEDAEHAAMVLASVAALARHGERLVLVAELDPALVEPGEDVHNGECVLSDIPTTAMTCWFSEASDVDPGPAAAAAKDLDIDTAWGFQEVQELLTAPLLWNDVEEYRRAR